MSIFIQLFEEMFVFLSLVAVFIASFFISNMMEATIFIHLTVNMVTLAAGSGIIVLAKLRSRKHPHTILVKLVLTVGSKPSVTLISLAAFKILVNSMVSITCLQLYLIALFERSEPALLPFCKTS